MSNSGVAVSVSLRPLVYESKLRGWANRQREFEVRHKAANRKYLGARVVVGLCCTVPQERLRLGHQRVLLLAFEYQCRYSVLISGPTRVEEDCIQAPVAHFMGLKEYPGMKLHSM
jgi:hypothetical protein